MAEAIPDEAIVVRGGQNRPQDFERGIATHPSGVTGFSVECGAGISVQELTRSIPHGQIGTTTVGRIREAGGDVVRTTGRTQYHATVIGLSPELASQLFTPTVGNPSKKQ